MVVKPGLIILVVSIVVISMLVWEFRYSAPWYIILPIPLIAGFIVGKIAAYVDNTIERGD